MEIIHLILGKANPDRMNGVNKVVYQLASRQAISGKKVSVWGITKDLTHNYGKRAFNTRLFQASKNPFGLDKELTKALLELEEDAIVHLHGGWIPTYATLGRFMRKNRIPFVLTPHGAYNTVAMQRNRVVKKLYFELFEKSLLIGSRKVHSLGESEVSGLNEMFSNTKTMKLPYGFESPALTDPVSAPTREFVVGFVGRLDVHTKGLDTLMEAFESFLFKNPDAKLWIVGDGEGRATLEKAIAQNGLEENVVMWGGRFGEEKDELMRQMTVFAHPSRNEGLPVAVLEAAAMGIPSVVTKATNVSCFVKQYTAGVEVENENAAALSAALEQLFAKWERNTLGTMGSNARKMVSEVFNWDTILEQFDQLYAP